VPPADVEQGRPALGGGIVDQVARGEHAGEAAAQIERVDVGLHPLGPLDVDEHLGRVVHRHDRMAQGHQRVRHPPGTRSQVQDRPARRHRSVHHPRHPPRRHRQVRRRRTAVPRHPLLPFTTHPPKSARPQRRDHRHLPHAVVGDERQPTDPGHLEEHADGQHQHR
jgi:hypothetical protein